VTTIDEGAAKEEYERQLEIKDQKIRELQKELALSKRLTADLMLNMTSVEQQVRKYPEKPIINWADDCECKQQVLAVPDLLEQFIVTERDTKKSKPEPTSGRNNKSDRKTQTEANTRKRDCTDRNTRVDRSFVTPCVATAVSIIERLRQIKLS
jgi:hypothetical protein